MFLQWKLILQKINLKNLTFILFGILFIGMMISFTGNSCGIEYILIINDISSYEQSLDPEFCEIIVEKIDLFIDNCESQIEILDCG